jgi:predicted metal-binding membrane protein
MGNLGWMLLFGALMAIEKNSSWGHRISTPLGIALLLSGIFLTVEMMVPNSW